MMLQLALYLLSTPSVYSLAPIALILVFIIAAAGLTRGLDIFQFFGVGALLGISQGAGSGGSGKGLKSGKSRGKLQGAIKEKYGAGHSGGKAIEAGARSLTKTWRQRGGADAAAALAKTQNARYDSALKAASGSEMQGTTRGGFLNMVLMQGRSRGLPKRSLFGVSENKLLKADKKLTAASTAANNQFKKVEAARAKYGSRSLWFRFQNWRYMRGTQYASGKTYLAVAPVVVGLVIPLPRTGRLFGLSMGYKAKEDYAQTRYDQRAQAAIKLMYPAPKVTYEPVATKFIGSHSNKYDSLGDAIRSYGPTIRASVQKLNPVPAFALAAASIASIPSYIRAAGNSMRASMRALNPMSFTFQAGPVFAPYRERDDLLEALRFRDNRNVISRAVSSYSEGVVSTLRAQREIQRKLKAGEDLNPGDFYVPGFVVAYANKVEFGEKVHPFKAPPSRASRRENVEDTFEKEQVRRQQAYHDLTDTEYITRMLQSTAEFREGFKARMQEEAKSFRKDFEKGRSSFEEQQRRSSVTQQSNTRLNDFEERLHRQHREATEAAAKASTDETLHSHGYARKVKVPKKKKSDSGAESSDEGAAETGPETE